MEYMWYAHYQHHLEIVQAIQKQKSVKLNIHPIYPFNVKNIQSILLNHQLFHDDMNSVLGLNGVDLQTVNLKDKTEQGIWTDQNFREHFAAASALKI